MFKYRIFSLLLTLVFFTIGCRNEDYIALANYNNDNEEYNSEQVDLVSYPDWDEETHSNAVDPNFDVVFAQNAVLRLDIAISNTDWDAMWSDLGSNISSSMGGVFRAVGGGAEAVDLDFTPIWVPCTVTYDGIDWYKVGVRFKGNSSLSTAYTSGNEKLSLKLDFDQYEDDYPALTNQRFYGFKRLNLNNNYNDESLMREKVGADLFREFGLAAPNTSFCALYIDTGSGAEYFGVYTIVEEVSDSVIKTQFADGSGNLYKPEEDASTFASGSYNTSEFNLKTNLDAPNYGDVRGLYDALHSTDRVFDEVAWRAEVESYLDVDRFLKWLAANIVIQNWDTYGLMGHNYFLYNNPSTGLLTWIPWDNNEAFQSGNSALSPDLSSVSSSWPLISYLYDETEYVEIYDGYLEEFLDKVWVYEDMVAIYESYYNLLKEYAYAEVSGRTFLSGSSSFDSAYYILKTHVTSRISTVSAYLD